DSAYAVSYRLVMDLSFRVLAMFPMQMGLEVSGRGVSNSSRRQDLARSKSDRSGQEKMSSCFFELGIAVQISHRHEVMP
ncbi:MAG: hypothetical protein KQI81_20260, partial [Deltaproteobacteria bacterium]|nr:hypothetical protein [Deltaproteobacteria bacterium]